VITYFSKG
jgi:hypothetical protein